MADAPKNVKTRIAAEGRIHINTVGLSVVMGVTVQCLAQWRATGCPQVERGWWDLRDVVEWKLKKNLDTEDFDAEEIGRRSLIADTRWKEERAAKQAIETAMLTGAVITREEVALAWASRAVEVRTRLASLPRRLCRDLVGREVEEIRRRIAEEVRLICDDYARDGALCPVDAGGEGGLGAAGEPDGLGARGQVPGARRRGRRPRPLAD